MRIKAKFMGVPYHGTNENNKFEWRIDRDQIEENREIAMKEQMRMDHKYDVANATEELNDLLNKPGILTEVEVKRVTQIMDTQTVLEKTKGEISLRELKNAIDDIDIRAKADQQKKLDQLVKDATQKRPAGSSAASSSSNQPINNDPDPAPDRKINTQKVSKLTRSIQKKSNAIKQQQKANRQNKNYQKNQKKMMKAARKTIKDGNKATKKN